MFRAMRRKKQQISTEECQKVLVNAKRGVLAVNGEGGYPYAVPINFFYDVDTEAIYVHMAKAGHKLDSIKNDNKVCFTVMDEGFLKDGDWAWYVNSVIAFGKIAIVEDEQGAREKAIKFASKYYPTREEVDAEMAADFNKMHVMKITIDHMTGKLVHEK